jgi:hypothetical protein
MYDILQTGVNNVPHMATVIAARRECDCSISPVGDPSTQTLERQLLVDRDMTF